MGNEVVALAGFQDKKRKSIVYPIYQVAIELLNGSTKTICAYGTNVITSSIERHAVDVEQNPLLAKLQLADPPTDKYEEVEIDLLLGSDYYYDFVNSERITLQNGIILLNSDLGYIIAGRLEGRTSSASQLLLTRNQCPDSNFELERLWKLEEVGIAEVKDSEEDESALKKFNDTVFLDKQENRYYVKWPLKEESPDLPTNFKLAYGRLKSLITKLSSSPSILRRYHETVQQQQENQMIEIAPTAATDSLIHYMPHHAVLKPNKTTKLRIVYDASSKITKSCLSLNDCMHRGPVMLQDLCGLMIRFRTKSTAIVSDVEKAFLQIGLQEPDRDLVRFLWLKEPTEPISSDNIVHYRFRRVCFGVVASPFLLAAVASHHLQQLNTIVAKDVLQNIYVDNIVSGADSSNEALHYYRTAKEMFASASMNIREWFSNNPKFIQQIPDEDRGEGTITKVLGMDWDTIEDKLSVARESISNVSTTPITKRVVLKCVAKIFDPCGYFTPITISGKFLLQQLWQKDYTWDDPLSKEIATSFRELTSEWEKIPDFKIQRLAGANVGLESTQAELHGFCDASIKAYSAAIYLKVSANSTSTTNLIFAKARISPLKTQSVPRLELSAVWIGAKLLTFVEAQLRIPVQRKVLWSDSQCVLHWVLGKPVSTRFVKHRVCAIKKYVNLEFRYVPSSENPADLPTRGTTFNALTKSTLWWNGPSWLSGNEEQWPTTPNNIGKFPCDPGFEMASEQTPASVATAIADTCQTDRRLMDISRFSSLRRAVTTQGYVKRFCNQALKRSRYEHLWLTTTERKEAMLSLVKEAQIQLTVLNSSKSGNTFKQLGVHADHLGILRCSTRIQHADLPDSAKEPILLPASDHLTNLIIQDCHERLLHAGMKHTLAALRYQYWLIRGRSVVKRVLRQCLLCKRQRGGPYIAPPEPPLPACRVKGGRVFAAVGIDYLGPLILYQRKTEPCKVWLCLFTCALSRALHLEVVQSMSAEVFLLAFRRFIAAWGTPDVIISDNAKQFLTAKDTVNRIWQEVLRTQDVQQFASQNGIEWQFIVERAPWMGGFYERMVGMVKTSLKAAINRKHLDLTELQTVVCEVTAVVNSRPLLYSEDEIGDHPITPSHLTCRHWSLAPLSAVKGEDSYLDKPVTTDQLIAGWKRLQNVVDEFWKSWNKQYLTSMRENMHAQKQTGTNQAQLGDTVLVGDKNLPRGRWRVGRINRLNTSKDGLVRSARVKLPGGKCITRSVTMLYPLELESHKAKPEVIHLQSPIGEEGPALESKQSPAAASTKREFSGPESIPPKSQRIAANRARARIRALAEDESD